MHRAEKLHMYPITASQEKEREIPLGTISVIRSYHSQRINSELFLNQALGELYVQKVLKASYWMIMVSRSFNKESEFVETLQM